MSKTHSNTQAPIANDPWVNDPKPNLLNDENAIATKDLARFSDIARFASIYWGGLKALAIMMVLIIALIYVVTRENWYASVRESIALTVQALSAGDIHTLLSHIWLPAASLIVIGVSYITLLKKYPARTDFIHAWGLAILIIVLATLNVKVGVELIKWSGKFWEDVKNKQVDQFIPGLILFAQLAFFSIIASIYRIFFSQMLQMRWRTWLTERFTRTYLSNERYYHLEQQGSQDNPDQRIADDLNTFSSLGVSLFFGFFLAALSVYEYSKALIKISGNIEFELFNIHFNIPHYMFWAALLYTLIGSTIIHFIGRRLVRINVSTERYNANFRYHLIRAREYAEGIGFLRGDAHHTQVARHLFTMIQANWYRFMMRIKYLSFSSSIYAQLGITFPIVVAAPRYFSGALTFGGIVQVIQAFGELREALSWFIDNCDTLATMRASSTRIFKLEAALADVDQLNAHSELSITPNNVGGVALSHVSLNRPQFGHDGQLQQKLQTSTFDWHIAQGERWLITGTSGSGKSTILRAIAQLWPYGIGQIDVPAKAKILFLPQRPYFPIASLRDALAYPATADAYNDAAYETALEMSQLSHLTHRLAESNNWGQILSGGEQQRLAFARVFLQRPEYLFLDEATASLDTDNEKALYTTLLDFLPYITLVSVSHHAQLAAYHNRSLHLIADPAGGFKAQIT